MIKNIMKKCSNWQLLIVLISFVFNIGIFINLAINSWFFKKNITSSSGDIIAKTGDILISKKSFYSNFEIPLYEKELELYKLRKDRIRFLITKKLLLKSPKRKEVANDDDFFEQFIFKKRSVSDDDVYRFVKERGVPKQYQTAQYISQIKNYLTLKLKEKLLDQWFNKKIKENGGLFLQFTEPVAPTIDLSAFELPIRGDGKVEILLVSDLICPRCRLIAEKLKEILKRYPKKFKLKFVPYYLKFNKNSKKLLEISFCLFRNKEEFFWDFYDRLMFKESGPSYSHLKKWAMSMISSNKSKNSIRNCIDGHKESMIIDEIRYKLGSKGVKAIPLMFIDGKFYRPHPKLKFLEKKLGLNL